MGERREREKEWRWQTEVVKHTPTTYLDIHDVIDKSRHDNVCR